MGRAGNAADRRPRQGQGRERGRQVGRTGHAGCDSTQHGIRTELMPCWERDKSACHRMKTQTQGEIAADVSHLRQRVIAHHHLWALRGRATGPAGAPAGTGDVNKTRRLCAWRHNRTEWGSRKAAGQQHVPANRCCDSCVARQGSTQASNAAPAGASRRFGGCRRAAACRHH